MPPTQDPPTQSTPNVPAPTSSPDQVASIVEAPRMASTTFPNWEAFSAYLDDYQRQTFQLYMCKSSTSAGTRNRRLAASKNKKPELYAITSRTMPTEIGFYDKTFICTHGGKPRSRSRGLRPRQQFRPIQCPARMNVLAKKRFGADSSNVSGWQVVVTLQRPTHNHPLDAETFKAYPRNRRVQDPMVLEAVNALRKAGVKQREIRKYITEKDPTKHVTRSDVSNLLTKLKTDDSFVTAHKQATSTRIESRSTSGATDTAPNQHEQLTTGSQEVGIEGVHLTSHLTSACGGGSGGNREVVITEQWSGRRGNQANPLQGLRNTSEDSSSNLRLRVRRLDEQNGALYLQNTKLHQQNLLYIAELNAAHKKAREETEALSQEVAWLKKENERWRSLAQQQSRRATHGDSEFQGLELAERRDVNDCSGNGEDERQVPKRAFSNSDVGDTFEPARPPKRPARDSTTGFDVNVRTDPNAS